MKDQIIQIGFKEKDYTGKGYVSNWLEYQGNGFYIDFCPDDDGYFMIYTDNSGDREAAPYDFKGIEKLLALIKAHEDYFK